MEHKSDKKSEVGQYKNPVEREAAIKDLCQAAKAGDVETITQLLKSAPSLMDEDPSKEQLPLYAAIEAPDSKAFCDLLSRSEEISAKQNGDTLTLAEQVALCQWPLAQKIDAIAKLAEKGVRLNPFLFAAMNGDTEHLLEEGSLAAKDSQGNTIAHYASANGQQPVLIALSGTDAGRTKLAEPNNFGARPFFRAVMNGQLSVAQWLVKNGAKVNEEDDRRRTALHHAAAHGQLEMVQWLLGSGAEIDEEDSKGLTALHHAAANGQLEMVQWLLTEGGALITDSCYEGLTALHHAAAHSQLEMVKWLVTNGATINEQDSHGQTALHHAAAHGQLEMVKWLVTNGATINEQDGHGLTALHHAAAHSQLNVAQWLVNEKKADIRMRDTQGLTALHHAAAKGQLNVAQWLVSEKKASIHARNSYGWTALHIAAAKGHLNVVKWLLTEGGARITEQLGNENLLQVAARHRQFGVVKLLVGEFGMSPDSITALPLDTTSIQNWRPALKLLFEMYYLRQQESLHEGITKTREKVREFSDLLLDLANIVAEYYGSPSGEGFPYTASKEHPNTALEKHQELFNKCLEWADTPSPWQHLSQQLINKLITDTPRSVSDVHAILEDFLKKYTKEITGIPFLTVIEQFLQITEKHIAQGLGEWLFFQPPSLSPAQLEKNEGLFQILQAEVRSSGFSYPKEKEFVEKILFQYPYNVGIVWEITNDLFPNAENPSSVSGVSKEFSVLMPQFKLAIREYLQEPSQDKTDQKQTAASSEKASPLANCPFLPRDKLILWQNEYLLRELKALSKSSGSLNWQSKNLADQLLDKISQQNPCNFVTIQQAVQAALTAHGKTTGSHFAKSCSNTLADIERLKLLAPPAEPKKEQAPTTQSPSLATSYTTKGPTDGKPRVTDEDLGFTIDTEPLREISDEEESIETKGNARPKFVPDEGLDFTADAKPLHESSEAKGSAVETKGNAPLTFRGRFLPKPSSEQPQATTQASLSRMGEPQKISASTSSSNPASLQDNPKPKVGKQDVATNYSPRKFKAPFSSADKKESKEKALPSTPQATSQTTAGPTEGSTLSSATSQTTAGPTKTKSKKNSNRGFSNFFRNLFDSTPNVPSKASIPSKPGPADTGKHQPNSGTPNPNK